MDFKYEHLRNFCFIYGLLGHTKRNCPLIYDHDAASIVKPYGPYDQDS